MEEDAGSMPVWPVASKIQGSGQWLKYFQKLFLGVRTLIAMAFTRPFHSRFTLCTRQRVRPLYSGQHTILSPAAGNNFPAPQLLQTNANVGSHARSLARVSDGGRRSRM